MGGSFTLAVDGVVILVCFDIHQSGALVALQRSSLRSDLLSKSFGGLDIAVVGQKMGHKLLGQRRLVHGWTHAQFRY